MQKSYMAKIGSVKKEWLLVDAEQKILGRLASRVAVILMGKHKPTYTPHVDTGDFVVVVNASKIAITGRKTEQKKYYAWSGYPGGLKEQTLHDYLEQKPEQVIRLAVRRMLPKSRLGRSMLKKLKIYADSEHPHTAQCPKSISV